jgi:hypothetical protein
MILLAWHPPVVVAITSSDVSVVPFVLGTQFNSFGS